MELAILIAVVVVALAFDYTNGFHDAANAIATSVSTRALTPRVALILAAVMNFVGGLLGPEGRPHGQRHHRHRGLRAHARPDHRDVRPARRDHLEPHHLVVRPAVVVVARADRRPRSARPSPRGPSCTGTTIVDKVLIPMVISPLAGFTLAFLLMLAFMWLLRKRNPKTRHPQLPHAPDRLGGGAWRWATASRTPRRRWA